ncbi:MAG: glycosyltransferase family 4 protein, partial [Verrucomicrobiota bacterium]
MKIAFIRQRFAAFGGAERYMNLIMERLARRGHEIHVLANCWNASPETKDITWHHVPMLRAFSFLRAWSFARNCQTIVRESDFDFVISLDRTFSQDV